MTGDGVQSTNQTGESERDETIRKAMHRAVREFGEKQDKVNKAIAELKDLAKIHLAKIHFLGLRSFLFLKRSRSLQSKSRGSGNSKG